MMSGSGGGKKFGEELVKKCIGAGCASTRPFMQDKNTDVLVNNNTSTMPPSPFQSVKQTSAPSTTYSNNNQSKMKEISKPIESIADKVIMNKPNSNLTSNKSPHTKLNNSEKTTTNMTNDKNYSTLKPSENMSATYNIESDIPETSMDFSMTVDDSINVPTAPLPPLLPLTKPIPQSTSNDPTLQQQIVTIYNEREARASEIILKLQQLEEYGLLKYQDNQEKLTPKFHELQKKTLENFVQIDIDFLQNNSNIVFELGMLEVINIDDTVLLSGLHTHVTVIYTIKDNQKIVMGYLTSNKNKTSSINLSDYQPFNDDYNNNKKQYFAPLQKPLVILEEKYLKHLSASEISEGSMQNQQQIGQGYINKKEIYDILQEHFKNKIIPEIKKQKGLLEIYDGKGITIEHIDYALQQADLIREQDLKKLMQQYKQIKNLQDIDKLENWFIQKENTIDKITFQELKKLIDTYEDKFK